MKQHDAERIVAVLDNLEARVRDIEMGIQRIRHELQDEFGVKLFGYDPHNKAMTPTSGATP